MTGNSAARLGPTRELFIAVYDEADEGDAAYESYRTRVERDRRELTPPIAEG